MFVAYIRDIFILRNYIYLENSLIYDELLKGTCLKRCAFSFFSRHKLDLLSYNNTLFLSAFRTHVSCRVEIE